jgi:hypothetical protein
MPAPSLTHSQALLAADPAMAGRIAAVLASEGLAIQSPDVASQAWALAPWVAAQPGMAAAYHAALLTGRGDAGTADDVITDGMLLAAVTGAVEAWRQAAT